MGQWQSQPVCTTPACLHASSSVLQNLAPNWEQMDPCTEFDKMVCSGFTEHNDDDTGTTGIIQSRNNRILRKILESSSHEQAAGLRSTLLGRGTIDEHNFDMLRAGYQSCMDTAAAAAAGVEPLTDLIISINKTWPASPNDLKTKVTASEYAGLARASLLVEQLNVQVFRSIVDDMPVVADPLNSKVNRFLIGLPGPIQKDTSVFADENKMAAYSQSMAKVFSLTYPNLNNETAGALAEAVVLLEADLAKALVPYKQTVGRENQWDFIKNVTIADMVAAAPALGLDKLVIGLSPAGHAPSSVLLEDIEPSLWPSMSQIFTSHPKAAVQGFVIWKTIAATSPFVTSPELSAILGGPSPTLQRWEICVEAAGTMLSRLLEHYFVSATYPEQALQAADKMTTSIRTQFKKRISELDWMGAEAKKRAAKKVDNLRQNIGYPKSNPDVRSMESLATYYEGVNFTSSFFDNKVTGRQHTTAKVYAALAGPVDRSEFVGPSITIVNAVYNQYANSMVIGAGISQLPIFHQDLPQYALYGGLGAVIGHELTHGFDSNGFKYDENAELRSWWDNATVANYLKRTECFVDQFSQYEVHVPGGKGKVNGNLTLAENLADAGGLRVAYDAWVEERKAMPNSWDQSLPGLDKFTHEQLFFVFFGNSWCNSKTPATALDQLTRDNHAPNGVRILGGAANSKAFRDAFKCKVREPTCEAF